LWVFLLYHIQFAFLSFYYKRYPFITVLFSCRGGKYLLAFTLEGRSPIQKSAKISERPNRLSYSFQ
jgi:hypothetical protein